MYTTLWIQALSHRPIGDKTKRAHIASAAATSLDFTRDPGKNPGELQQQTSASNTLASTTGNHQHQTQGGNPNTGETEN